MPYTVHDRRGLSKEEIKETCRVCGSKHIHTRSYNNPTMGCIKHYREIIASLEKQLDESNNKEP